MVMNEKQFSAYDERPDPKGPGQQGVLFRKVAPAQDQRVRQHLAPERSLADMGASYGVKTLGDNPVDMYNASDNWKDTRLAKGRATGMVPTELYHGTSARLKPGSLIKPGKPANFPTERGGLGGNARGTSLDVNHEHVFATGNLHEAYHFARNAQDVRGRSSGGHVYRVQPTGPVQTDAEDLDTRAGYNTDSESGETYAAGEFQSKRPLRVMNEVQFSEAKEAHRSYNEDELGMEPGDYKWAAKPKQEEMW